MVVLVVTTFMLVLVVAVFMVVAAMLPKMLALHVDATVEIRVRLVHERAAYRLASVAKRDGKCAFTLHDLWHRVAKARALTRQDNDMPNPQKQA